MVAKPSREGQESERGVGLEADPGMLEQVVMNLVVNARDAMPDGGRVALTTRLVELDDDASQRNPESCPGQFVCLAVSDTGSGMDEATVKHIFEPFFTTKEAGKGTGLGLATVYGIVKQHRGWTEGQTTVGRGSTFNVFLPATAQPVLVASKAATLESVRGGPETLLLVEDDDLVRRMLGATMQQLGYRVLVSNNGLTAIKTWEQQKGAVDLLVTDVVLPGGINGVEPANRLLAEKPGLKVILISGYSPETERHGLPHNQALRFLQKPFEAAALARLIRESLDG